MPHRPVLNVTPSGNNWQKLLLEIRTYVPLTDEIQYTWSFACLLLMRATVPFFCVHMLRGYCFKPEKNETIRRWTVRSHIDNRSVFVASHSVPNAVTA